jgi:hypothetical protein
MVRFLVTNDINVKAGEKDVSFEKYREYVSKWGTDTAAHISIRTTNEINPTFSE